MTIFIDFYLKKLIEIWKYGRNIEEIDRDVENCFHFSLLSPQHLCRTGKTFTYILLNSDT